jgi:hypothetical protein
MIRHIIRIITSFGLGGGRMGILACQSSRLKCGLLCSPQPGRQRPGWSEIIPEGIREKNKIERNESGRKIRKEMKDNEEHKGKKG